MELRPQCAVGVCPRQPKGDSLPGWLLFAVLDGGTVGTVGERAVGGEKGGGVALTGGRLGQLE